MPRMASQQLIGGEKLGLRDLLRPPGHGGDQAVQAAGIEQE
jgi:hypothetical protein